jgi:hypothetical protein
MYLDKYKSLQRARIEGLLHRRWQGQEKYTFGSEASVAVTSKGVCLLGNLGMPASPYDGRCLAQELPQVRRRFKDKRRKEMVTQIDMRYLAPQPRLSLGRPFRKTPLRGGGRSLFRRAVSQATIPSFFHTSIMSLLCKVRAADVAGFMDLHVVAHCQKRCLQVTRRDDLSGCFVENM